MIEYKSVVFNAARDGNLRRLKVFLDPRSDADVKSLLTSCTFGTPPIVIAARNGHLDVVRYLVEKKVDIEQTGCVIFDGDTIEGAPSLWCAAAAGHFEMVKFLIEKHANVNHTTATNSTPLRAACYDGHLTIIKYLVEHGADVEIANRHGHTCLMIACYRGHVNVVKYLLSVNANVNARSLKGNTALHDCAESSSVEIMRLLLDEGAHMTADSVGLTPLLSAASLGNSTVVGFLSQRPEVAPEQLISAFQLLGATYVDKKRDIVSAARCWRRAIQLRRQCDRPAEQIAIELASHVAYDGAREAADEQQLESMLRDPEQTRMQALVLRERVLGPLHPDTTYYIRYRGAVYADVGMFERCVDLWLYALSLQQTHMEPLCSLTIGSFVSFAELFVFLFNESSQGIAGAAHVAAAPDASNRDLRPPVVERALGSDEDEETAVAAAAALNNYRSPSQQRQVKFDDLLIVLWRAVKEIQRSAAEPTAASVSASLSCVRLSAESTPIDDHQPGPSGSRAVAATTAAAAILTCRHADKEDEAGRKMLLVVLHLSALAVRCLSKEKERTIVNGGCSSVVKAQAEATYSTNRRKLQTLLYELVRADPRDYRRASLLHLACDERSSVLGNTLCRFPAVSVVELLIEAGADVACVDASGDTPLHTCLQNKARRRSIALTLLRSGACLFTKNPMTGHTPLALCRWSGVVDLPLADFTRLTQWAAAAVRRHNVPYRNRVPCTVVPLLERV